MNAVSAVLAALPVVDSRKSLGIFRAKPRIDAATLRNVTKLKKSARLSTASASCRTNPSSAPPTLPAPPYEPGSRQTKGAPMEHLGHFALFDPSRPTTPTVCKRPWALLATRAAVPRFSVFRSHCKQSVNVQLRGRNLSIVQNPQLRPALNRRQLSHSAEQMLTAQNAFQCPAPPANF